MIQPLTVFQVQRLLIARDITSLQDHFQQVHRHFDQGRLTSAQLASHYDCLDLERRAIQPGLERWVEMYPNDYSARFALGNFHLHVGWRARGIGTSDRTTERQFEVMNAHFEQGLPHLLRAIDAHPHPHAALRTGISLEKAGCLTLPVSFIALAERHLPHSQPLCESYMWALQPKWGGDEGALEAFHQRTLSFDWTPQEHAEMALYSQRMQADILRCQGDWGQALSQLLPLLEQYPGRPGLLSNVGDLHSLRKEHAAAARCYEQAASARPSAGAFEDLANALEAMGDDDGARRANEAGAELGNGECAAKLACALRTRMKDPQVAVEARHWCDLGTEQYCGSAIFERAVHHNLGLGTKKNRREAVRLWCEAAEWGNWTALKNCVISYSHLFNGVPRDFVRARHYAQMGAHLGDPDNMAHFGIMLSRGRGGAKDHDAALPWLFQAATQDQPQAIAWLVRALWYGRGTSVDRATAREWLERLKRLDAGESKETRSEILGLVGRLRSFWGQWRSGPPT